MSSLILYGIPHCGTVKKARAWLSAQGWSHRLHDFKRDGVPHDLLLDWMNQVGWEALLNPRGTTWRGLDPLEQQAVCDAPSAVRIMQQYPSVIRRPIIVTPHGPLIGFDLDQYQQHFAKAPA